MSPANAEPFVSNHQKNPVKIVNLINSAKNSPISAFLRAIKPKVQIIEIDTNNQNSHEAAFSITATHIAA